MNVLSTFNGMGCIWVALDKIGAKVNKRYSSEIDKHANIVNNANYPDTIQLGDICDIKGGNIDKIDLLVGGNPCQGFSLAGKRLNFKDPRSKLFFEFVRLKDELKPKYFLLENVRMKKESRDIISKYLGVEPIVINSSLVSAQNRVRYYWTNIPNVNQPKDRRIYLKDIVLNGLPSFGCAIRGRYTKTGKTAQQLEFNNTEKSNALTTVYKDSLCCQVGNANIKGNQSIRRVYSTEGKSPTLTAMTGGLRWPKINIDDLYWRRLEPIECERLQTLPDNYTAHVSNTQRYKMLGNGWTVDVITHLLKNMIL